jgi:hypothetical protein
VRFRSRSPGTIREKPSILTEAGRKGPSERHFVQLRTDDVRLGWATAGLKTRYSKVTVHARDSTSHLDKRYGGANPDRTSTSLGYIRLKSISAGPNCGGKYIRGTAASAYE